MKYYMKVKCQVRRKGQLVSEPLWKYDEFWIFLCEPFSFYEKVPSLSDPVGFFSKFISLASKRKLSLTSFFNKFQVCKLQHFYLRIFKTLQTISPVVFFSFDDIFLYLVYENFESVFKSKNLLFIFVQYGIRWKIST